MISGANSANVLTTMLFRIRLANEEKKLQEAAIKAVDDTPVVS
jgi:hypothetical protein